MSQKTEWNRVSKSKPCPVCESNSWCLMSVDGCVAICMRVKSDHPREMSDGNIGYIHKLNDATAPKQYIQRPKERRITDSELSARLGPLCRSWYIRQSEATEKLANTLGVAAYALDDLHVGFDGQCWTFPEMNHLGQIIGVKRRFPDSSKYYVVGSRPGLTYSDSWSDTPGPVLIVEGGSDVAAGITLGVSVVGRPSNMGGVEYLAKLLRHERRRIIVLAERDHKPHETLRDHIRERHDPNCKGCAACYPGRYGAQQTSIRLSRKLERIVEWKFLPDGAKDLREWLNRAKADVNNEQAMGRLRNSLTRRLEHGCKTRQV